MTQICVTHVKAFFGILRRPIFTDNRRVIDELARPFDSIESAQEFMALLQDSVAEAAQDVGRKLENTPAGERRRAEALQLAHYKLAQLTSHVHKSRRILNDLRIIRKLLVNEYSAENVRGAVAK